MSLRRTRAIAYGVVALLGVAAVLFTRPLPPVAHKPGDLLSEVVPNPWRERHDTVGRGESLASVLARGGLSDMLVRQAIGAAKMIDPRRIPVGMPVVVRSDTTDTLKTEVILQLAVDRFLHLQRDTTGWTALEERLPWKTDTIVVSGTVRTNLYAAMDSGAVGVLPFSARQDLTISLANIYEFRVDMTRDLQVGDQFRVVAVRSIGPGGIVRIGNILAATMKLSGKTTEAIRFESQKVGNKFFDQNGKSLRTGFLRNPVEFRRISSGFGMRRHPILGTMRKHQGTDYAANAGTPVRAVGDGVVIQAGWGNGYGNVILIRHANGYVTKYGHMRGFAKGIYAGARVSIEQIIGYVGSTGLSTAPHLHFEVIVRGVQTNPRVALANATSDPVPNGERVAFASARTQMLALLESPALVASAESAMVRQAGARQQ
jgi:murein DD-endopeptidase MepM/ murein hydrolase activator NlpD